MNIERESEIARNVYIGNHKTAQDIFFFLNHRIHTVVNCTQHLPNFFENHPWFPWKVDYYRIPVNDSDDPDSVQTMSWHLPRVLSFLETQMQTRGSGGGILIHCQAGISRSATVAAAFLFQHCHLPTLSAAIQKIVHKRPPAFYYGQNIVFIKALQNTFPNQFEDTA